MDEGMIYKVVVYDGVTGEWWELLETESRTEAVAFAIQLAPECLKSPRIITETTESIKCNNEGVYYV